MFEDTTKRLQSLQEQMDNGTVKDRIIAPLGDMIQGELQALKSMRAWNTQHMKRQSELNSTKMITILTLSLLTPTLVRGYSALDKVFDTMPGYSCKAHADGV